MVQRRIVVLLAVLLGTVLTGCSLVEAFQEVRDLQKTLEDEGYANPKVNISINSGDNTTTRTITVNVDRPRNAGSDQQIATRVADLVILNYSGVSDVTQIVVELHGNGPTTRQSLTPAEWRDLARDAREPPGIATAVLARDVRGGEFEPVDVTTDFPADQRVFHAVVRVRNLPADTTVKAVWIAVDTHGAAPPNTEMVAKDVKADGTRRLHFTMEPNAGSLPKGKYKLDLFWADKLDRTLPFTVAGG